MTEVNKLISSLGLIQDRRCSKGLMIQFCWWTDKQEMLAGGAGSQPRKEQRRDFQTSEDKQTHGVTHRCRVCRARILSAAPQQHNNHWAISAGFHQRIMRMHNELAGKDTSECLVSWIFILCAFRKFNVIKGQSLGPVMLRYAETSRRTGAPAKPWSQQKGQSWSRRLAAADPCWEVLVQNCFFFKGSFQPS